MSGPRWLAWKQRPPSQSFLENSAHVTVDPEFPPRWVPSMFVRRHQRVHPERLTTPRGHTMSPEELVTAFCARVEDGQCRDNRVVLQ